MMPRVPLDAGDAAELAELLQFVRNWLTSDHNHLDISLNIFLGTPGYDLDRLRTDLDRFTFLLRGSDGDLLFQA
jgi:hypothetical protein